MNEFLNSPTLIFNSSSDSGFNIARAIDYWILLSPNIFKYSEIALSGWINNTILA
jgi:hypothetical protein